MIKSKPQVVLFDVGNTLLFPNWPRILAPLKAKGIWPETALLQQIERKTKRQFDREMTKGKGKVDHSFWQMFYSHLLDSVGQPDGQLQQQLISATHTSANWDIVLPGTRDTLMGLGQKYRLGVISNADGKIHDVLTFCGIGDCFLHVTDSGIVGYEKPHPGIFSAALEKMNVAAEKAIYVGDVWSVDYVGATSAGMQAILFDVAGAYRDDGLPRVESLTELEIALDEAYN